MTKRIALIDGNNFFVSCERVFDPTIERKPVVVLSSNDACIIARSNQAKALGIKMGMPAFKCKELLVSHNVVVRSANFSLYADMSDRLMHTLASFMPELQVYSIDEAFAVMNSTLSLAGIDSSDPHYYTQYAAFVRRKIKQHIGLPVSIGIGPTKTLAKLANYIAKTAADYNGVFDITDHPDMHALLAAIDVKEIWGVGRRYGRFLQARGIKTVADFIACDERWVRAHMTIGGLKTLHELRGISCDDAEEIGDTKKSITVSRSFGINVTERIFLQEALAYHATTAGRKLREQRTDAAIVHVFVSYVTHIDHERRYDGFTIALEEPTSYTPDLIRAAYACLQRLYHQGRIYKKIGIILSGFTFAHERQLSMCSNLNALAKKENMMRALDAINKKIAKDTLFYAAAGCKKVWQPKKGASSAAYTTNWRELLTIKI